MIKEENGIILKKNNIEVCKNNLTCIQVISRMIFVKVPLFVRRIFNQVYSEQYMKLILGKLNWRYHTETVTYRIINQLRIRV